MQTNKKAKQFFITILLLDNQVQSALWHVKNDKIEVTHFSKTEDFADERDCVVKIDKSLQELGSDSENVNEVVFGFGPNWISAGGLKDDRRPLLKKITDDLGLEPMGFVVTSEATYQTLTAADPKLSVICVCLGLTMIELVLISEGKLIATLSVKKSDDIAVDLKEGFIRLAGQLDQNDKGLPNKILFFSPSLMKHELEEQQKFLQAVEWPNGSLFPQPPVIETMPAEFLVKSVSDQGGKAVAQQRGLINVVVKEGPAEAEGSTQAMSFGVPISENKVPEAQLQDEFLEVDKPKNSLDDSSPQDFVSSKKSQVNLVNQVKSFFSRFKQEDNPFAGLVKNQQGNFSSKKTIILGAVIGLLSLLIFSYIGLQFMAQIFINIQLNKVAVAKEVDITVDPNATESDPENLILSASLVKEDFKGQNTVETTGIKLVGEKAKGKVLLYNTTTEIKKFTSGTILKSGDLEFSLDEDVEIPAAEDEGDTIKKGQKETNITASEIGAESNIAKDAELGIASFSTSTYSAKVLEDFTGGASREVRVVSSEDLADLLSDLTKELEKESITKFEEDSAEGRFIIPIGQVKQIVVEFDAKEGDEVDNLTLDLTITAQAVAYLSEDLRPLAEEVLKSEVPEGYKLTDKEPEVLSSLKEETEEGNVVLSLNISSQAIPNINKDQLLAEVKGESLEKAKLSLEQSEAIKKAEIKFKPQIASLVVRKLPKKTERITIEVLD